MKNVKFHGIPRKKDEFRGEIPRQKPKFRGLARNFAGRGKLWALFMSHKSPVFKPGPTNLCLQTRLTLLWFVVPRAVMLGFEGPSKIYCPFSDVTIPCQLYV